MKIRRTAMAMAIIGMMIATVFVMAADNPDKQAKAAKVAEKPKEVSQTRSASCILRISFDPSVLPLNAEMLDYLVKSSGILGKVTREILNYAELPDVTLTEISPNGGVVPMGEPSGMGGGMGGGMMGGMGGGMGRGMMRGGMMGGMGGGMMGMGGVGGGRASGMAGGGGGGMSMSVNPPDAPDAPAMPEDPTTPSTGTAPSSSNAPDRNSADIVRDQAERQAQEARQQARQAERQAMEAGRRMAEQLQARYGDRSTGMRRDELVNLMPGPAGSTQDLLIHFELQLADEHIPAATEAMEAIIDLLGNALARDFDQYKERMAKRADLAEKQAKDAEAQVRKLQAQIQELSPSKDLNRFSLMDEISNCRDQIRKNQLEDELNRAMVDNLNQQIDEAKKKADVQMVQDPVMKDLETMLSISKERVDAAKQLVAAGQANQNALQEAMEKLTRANIELAQRREQIGVSAGAERINELLKRMSDISLQTTKSRIQLERLEQRIREADGQLAKSVDYEMLGMRLDLAKEKLRESLRRAESMKDNHSEPPLVTPIGAD
jgi:hypothetical protein